MRPSVMPNERRDGRILLVGEHHGRLRQLAEALLRAGCRVEIAGLRDAGAAAVSLGADSYRFLLVDAISLSRESVDRAEHLRAGDPTVPVIALVAETVTRHRLGGAHHLAARIGAGCELGDVQAVVRDTLRWWENVQPLHGPAELRVDRIAARVTVRGRQLALRPFDYRLLAELAREGTRGTTPATLAAVAWRGRVVDGRRAITGVRRGLERLRSALRRSGITVLAGADGRYRLVARADAAMARDRSSHDGDEGPS